MASIQINPENIVMTFNKDGKLLGLGKTNAGVRVIDVPVQKSITGEINLDNSADAVNKYKKTVAKALLSTDFKTEYKKDEGVIVKLQVGAPGSEKFLYIPGIIADDTSSANANANVIVGEGGKIQITDVPLINICSNFKLKENETGFFFSDRVIKDVLKNATVAFGSITDAQLNDIIQGTGKTNVTGINGEKYNHNEITLINTNKIDSNTAKQKNVVPMGFNNVNDLANPSEIRLTIVNQITDNTVVFGGKKSKKQKTRKNTMPLQFAPGAKRAYLKRRKSSRK
jgi:hypothetical protein